MKYIENFDVFRILLTKELLRGKRFTVCTDIAFILGSRNVEAAYDTNDMMLIF